MKVALPALFLILAFAPAFGAPGRPVAVPDAVLLEKLTPAQQCRYAHLLLDADDRARVESGCDPALDDGSREDFPLYRRLREKYQEAVQNRCHFNRSQRLALLREAYAKRWNIQ